MLSANVIRAVLQQIDPIPLPMGFIDKVQYREIKCSKGIVTLTAAVNKTRYKLHAPFREQLQRELTNLPGVNEVKIDFVLLVTTDRADDKKKLPGLADVKNIIAVASGKGGVGKTSIAINLALALAAAGKKAGILDADIYGPSIPVMMGLENEKISGRDMLQPVRKFDLSIISLGMTVSDDQPFIWRGPLVAKMIHRLLARVDWGELDYLVIDLPPGTGDPSITVAQTIPRTRILMVTTPQEVALADVRRSITLFHKHSLEIFGIIENMSWLQNDDGSRLNIFGEGGGNRLASENNLPLLAEIPLDPALGIGGDTGAPLFHTDPACPTSRIFSELAAKIIAPQEQTP